MKLTPEMKQVDLEGNLVTMHPAMWRYILEKQGVKSKKRRIQKKVVKRVVSEAIRIYVETNR